MVVQLNELAAQQAMGLLGHDVDEMSYEQLLELQERIGFVSKGLTNDQIDRCVELRSAPNDTQEVCAICQEDLREVEAAPSRSEVRDGAPAPTCAQIRSCSHVFHHSCLRTWLAASKSCPLCKGDVV
jgi:hypothetical protein